MRGRRGRPAHRRRAAPRPCERSETDAPRAPATIFPAGDADDGGGADPPSTCRRAAALRLAGRAPRPGRCGGRRVACRGRGGDVGAGKGRGLREPRRGAARRGQRVAGSRLGCGRARSPPPAVPGGGPSGASGSVLMGRRRLPARCPASRRPPARGSTAHSAAAAVPVRAGGRRPAGGLSSSLPFAVAASASCRRASSRMWLVTESSSDGLNGMWRRLSA